MIKRQSDRIVLEFVLEGILQEGYGLVAKKVMRDSVIGAVALYGYFASYAGAGMNAWPQKATIYRELGVHPETYNKYLSQLISKGYGAVNSFVLLPSRKS